MHNYGMGRDRRHQVIAALTRLGRSVADGVRRWRGRPPEEAGSREPRRPRPTLPAAAVALDEPRTSLRRRLRPAQLWERAHGR
jgi:hypothetical protein